MRRIISLIVKRGSNLPALWVTFALPIGILGVLAVRTFAGKELAAGDGAVIVMVPCVLTALAFRFFQP